MAARKKSAWKRWADKIPKRVRTELKRLGADIACDEAWLRARSEQLDSGCLIWRGMVRVRDGKARGYARPNRLTEVPVDRAMWRATRGKALKEGRLLRTTCGTELCIEPAHLTETNAVLERARKKART